MKRLLVWICLAVLLQPLAAQEHKALREWQAQKYSMFIHWGAIYSTLGGVWEGKAVTRGYSEQIQAHAGIYSDTYGAVAGQFKAPDWNADSIVLLAKAAGMRSIVITSKHHDGFCMFHSAYTDYNVVDATPFGRDVVKELSDACKRHGLRFGLYFSLIDWHYPQAYPISSTNSDPITPEHHNFNKQQITELLSNYGPISELWFDMGSQTAQQSRELADLVHRLQPDCMVSGRLGNDAGDFCVMGDNNYPDYQIAAPWQTPASVYDETWGYRSWQEHGKPEDKAREKLEGLIKVAARGGNYLLNIGPRGDGSVVDFEKDVLLRIGQWLQRNGDAIYGSHANPFDTTFSWGEVTAKNNLLYLHLLRSPDQRTIVLPGLKGKISRISLVENGQRLKCRVRDNGDGQTILLPEQLQLDGDVKVLALELPENYTITPRHVIPWPNGGEALRLSRQNATRHYSFSGVDYESYYRSTVGLSWAFLQQHGGPATLSLAYTAQEKGRQVWLDIDGHRQLITLNGATPFTAQQQADIQWGPMYVSGPYRGGIDGELPGGAASIDPSQAWPTAKDQPWTLKADWKNDVTYTLDAGRSQNWYVLQEITAGNALNYQIGISSGDGVQVFLNGVEQIVHNNPERGATQEEILQLPLQQGKNQLLVKFYNRFNRQINWSIRQVPQQRFVQDISLEKGLDGKRLHRVMVTPAKAVSVHRDMGLSNLELIIHR
jgi:alpha-L-fucosidase